MVVKEVWVICPDCEAKHQLLPGIESPFYWCSDNLRTLNAGDSVEIMNKLDHHDIISHVIYGDYCRLDKRFTEIIKWAANEVRIDANVRMSVLLKWAIYVGGN